MRTSITPIAGLLATAAAFTAAPHAATAQASAMAAATAAERAPVVQVNTGRGRLVTLAAPMSDLFVANPEVADVQVRSPRQLYIFGKKPGETTVSATTKAGAVVFSSTVRVGNNLDSIGQMLGLAMPEARIVATPMNGLILLTGTVSGPDDASEAERLVTAYVGEGTKVISRLRTATPLQVNLQVKIVEVSRSFLKNIGNNLVTRDTTNGFQFGILSGRPGAGSISGVDTSALPQLDASSRYGFPAGTLKLPFDPRTGQFVLPNSGAAYKFTQSTTDRSTLGLAGKLLGLDVLSALDLGERTGQVTTLANPNLTALSGETATFLAGGEIPIPIAQTLGTVSVEYKQYGVSLAYTPTVLADGRISMRVRPEVSELSVDGAVTLNGTQIPALTVRRAETTVELGSGQSFMIGGLLSTKHNNGFDKTPGVADLPILGALFRSNSFQRQESELVIVVTPYLVKPVNANDIVLPTDGMKAPTDAGRVFMGQLSDGQSGGDRPKPTLVGPAPAAPAAGVVAPVSPMPQPGREPAKADKPKPARAGAALPAPGFSN